jgi:hypothetical protein
MAKKPTAADRTMGLFGQPPVVDEAKALAEAEVLAPEEKGERVPVEQDADRMRDAAFKGQEWTSKYFGSFEAPGNEYRLTQRGPYYYLETILKEVGKPTAYGYTGVMVHERDLMELTKVMVAAVRAKQAKEKV